MGFLSNFFSSRSSSGQVKSSSNSSATESTTYVRHDRITKTGGGKHTHEGVSVNARTGEIRTYGGGENSSDRNYERNSDSP